VMFTALRHRRRVSGWRIEPKPVGGDDMLRVEIVRTKRSRRHPAGFRYTVPGLFVTQEAAVDAGRAAAHRMEAV
jgi:hypothetical protein